MNLDKPNSVQKLQEKILLLEAEVESREQTLELTQSLSKIGSWEWDISSNQVRWSPELYRMYGLSPETFNASYEGFIDRIHPDDRDFVNTEVQKAFKTGNPWEFHHRLLRPDGEIRVLLGKGNVISRNGKPVKMYGTAQDITKEWESRQNTDLSYKLTQKIYEAPDLYTAFNELLTNICERYSWDMGEAWTFDKHSGYYLFSGNFVRDKNLHKPLHLSGKQFKFKPGEAILKVINQENPYVWSTDILKFPAFVRKKEARASGIKTGIAIPIWSKGHIHSVMMFFDRVAEKKSMSTVEFLQFLCHNVAHAIEKKSTEDEMRKSEAQLKEFAYAVSHDLKEPLRGIATLSLWLSQDYQSVLDQEGQRNLILLNSRVKRLNSLIDGILEYSKIGRVKDPYTEFEVSHILKGIVESIEIKGDLVIKMDKFFPRLYTEKARIEQIFQNLIYNAVQFMDKPNGEINIKYRKSPDALIFKIIDNGPGIDPKHQKRVFNIFQTLVKHQDERRTGIGLTIVQRIIEDLGGEISLKSKLGEGSTFTISLPRSLLAHVKK